MVVHDLVSVIHATEVDLDGFSIEDFSKLVVFREVLIY